MRVFITGATGFVGRALVLRLRRQGHTCTAWVRSLARGRALLGQEATLVDATGGPSAMDAALVAADAVVNLAGENIMAGRWSAARKDALMRSRVDLTEALVQSLRRLTQRPRVLISASAVGLYGSCGATTLDEQSAAGDDFLAQLCTRWEATARQAEALGVRVVLPRIGIVLGHEGGMLDKLLPLFELGLGGPIADGQAYVPWIHLHDLVESMVVALDDASFQGVYNAFSPHPVTNAVFTATLAAQVGKAAPFRVPKFFLQLALGEAAVAVLASMRVVPGVLEKKQFKFFFPTVSRALQALLDPKLLSIRSLDATTPKPDAASEYVTRRKPYAILQAQTHLTQARSDVFDFFCRAENLGLMTPTQMAMQITGDAPKDMQEGVQIRYTLKVGPVPLRWRTRIARWDPGRLFVDAQEQGPYRCWYHEHHFADHQGGTLMTDRVYYAAPFGIFGRLANGLMIRRQLHHIFWYRASAITLRFGPGA